jgi:ubiquinone biosynthesis monooxygenase Coq7
MSKQVHLDAYILEFDAALRTIFPPQKRVAARTIPLDSVSDSSMTPAERKHAAGLMRVNHVGEVCAQALYRGQALTAELAHIRAQMQHAADEEIDHLAWCEARLQELGSAPSVLNVLWYTGSLLMGLLAGYCGDAVSLGFVAETERQVGAHLEAHLQALPKADERSRLIVKAMREDELAHAENAVLAGAMELPWVVKSVMRVLSTMMTKMAYYL